jgi:hypothetical protein
MRFDFLIEDQSGAKAMKELIPKLLGESITFKVHPYKGLGHIPRDLKPKTDASRRILLDQLPKILNGYNSSNYSGIIVIICDLDNKDEEEFFNELKKVAEACEVRFQIILGIAVEEFEAWYLGDLKAIRLAYPLAKDNILNSYKNDAICGTWEVLADALYRGGCKALSKKGWKEVGRQKSIWAEKISPHMNVDENASPSFQRLRSQLRRVAI